MLLFALAIIGELVRRLDLKTLETFFALLILEIAEAFKLFDKNGDGQISVEELGEAMKQAGQEVCEEDLQEMIKAVDRNGKVSSRGSISSTCLIWPAFSLHNVKPVLRVGRHPVLSGQWSKSPNLFPLGTAEIKPFAP